MQFPGFLWQTQFATLVQWTRTFDDGQAHRAKNLMAVLSERMSDEQKRFWSSFERIRELNVTGELDGVNVQFRIERVPGDGDCGYRVIGVPCEMLPTRCCYSIWAVKRFAP